MSTLGGLRVLVVENDDLSASLLQMQLIQSGGNVVGVAATVAEALERIGTCEPQVVLLDYRLAGNESSEPVAADLLARGIPFVVATGMEPARLPPMLARGVVLTKPYLSADLLDALLRALEQDPVRG